MQEREVITLNYSRKNNFMNHMKSAERVEVDPETGDEIASSPYAKPTPPKIIQRIRIPYDIRRRTYVINPDLKKGELNKLVKDCMLTYEEGPNAGAVIEEANPRNKRDPFFIHSDLYLELTSGTVSIVPEDPIHKIFLESFKADNRINEGGKGTKMKNAKVQWTLSKSGDNYKEKEVEVDETKKALKKLWSMEPKQMRMILTAMGTLLSSDSTDKRVETVLTMKITEDKDRKVNGVRNIDLFNKYSKAPVGEMQLRSIVTQAYDQGIIGRASGNRYKYGDLVMGTSIDKVMEFLDEKDNEVIKKEIVEKTSM